ncbi:MAG: helix-turn-helix domain-containing protein [Eubacterium sp.]|nr:helix-turn-helix domain-containing protein [Eubacterium sp.]
MEYTKMLSEYKDILLPEDVQKILHIGRNTVYKYLAEGKIRSIKIGKKYRIPKNYLLEFIYPDMKYTEEVG